MGEYILFDNFSEFLSQQKNISNKTKIILTSQNFGIDDISIIREKYQINWIDDFIEDKSLLINNKLLSIILWNWYLDEHLNDLSDLNGFSIGQVFTSSIEILLVSILKFWTFSKIFSNGDIIRCSSNLNYTYLSILKYLNTKKVIKLIFYKEVNQTDKPKYNNINFDLSSRQRNLKLFTKKKTVNKQIINFCNMISMNFNRKNILIFPSSKFDFIVKKFFSSFKNSKINVHLPVSKKLIFENLKYRNIKIFDENYQNTFDDKIFEALFINLKFNLNKKNYDIPSELIFLNLSNFIFPYVNYFYNIFLNLDKYVTLKKIDYIIVFANVIESSIIYSLIGKKNNIKVIFSPHGMNCWGYHQLIHSKKNKIFNFLISYSQIDTNKFINIGFNEKNIINLAYPFLKKNNFLNNNKSALILLPDRFVNIFEKDKNFYGYLSDIVEILDELNININGLKSRHSFSFNYLKSNNKYTIINKKKINIYSGYGELNKNFKNINMIIGPISSALIESVDANIEYYVYHQEIDNYLKVDSFICDLNSYYHVAKNKEELKENIEKKKTFKNQFNKSTLFNNYDKDNFFEIFK